MTEIKPPCSGSDLLQKWKIINNKKNETKLSKFLRSTKTSSSTGESGVTSIPPIGSSFLYIETSSNNHGSNVFCSFELTDIIQITNITFHYNRFSILTNDLLKSMGRFRIQLFLKDDIWSNEYTIPKNSQYSDGSTDWTLLNLSFTVENYGKKLIYDEIDTPHADLCFSNFTITHSVF